MKPMATRNQPPWQRTRTALRVVGEGSLLILLAGLAWAWIWIADALMHVPEPETRCFTGAVAEMSYCRTQGAWE